MQAIYEGKIFNVEGMDDHGTNLLLVGNNESHSSVAIEDVVIIPDEQREEESSLTSDQIMFRGWVTLIIGLVFNMVETGYFGWNMVAQSVQEAYCDILSALIIFVGLAYIIKGIFSTKVKSKVTITVHVPDQSKVTIYR